MWSPWLGPHLEKPRPQKEAACGLTETWTLVGADAKPRVTAGCPAPLQGETGQRMRTASHPQAL